MEVLVIAEHDNDRLTEASLATITAASRLGGNISVLVAGHNCEAAAGDAVAVAGVNRVLHAEAEHYAHGLAEELAPLIASVAAETGYILAPATTFGKNLLPRAAALLGVDQISDVIEIQSGNVFVRPIYAGNALATVRSDDPVKVLTIRATAFAAAVKSGAKASVEVVEPLAPRGLSVFVRLERSQTDQPELTSAKIVVAGGRGVGSAGNFRLVEELAGRLNAAIGATRAAVDAGFISNDFQIGQTGKIIAPDLYIAIGVSGAIQHLAGIRESRCIVAINNDEDAPIFEIADYGLVEDLFEALPELQKELG